MKLTPFAKVFLVLVILGVGGFIGFKKYGDNLRSWSGSTKPGDTKPGDSEIKKDDFNFVGDKNVDAPRTGEVAVTANTAGAALGAGKLNRPLIVGINTWAGHAPGIVANGGMEPGSAA